MRAKINPGVSNAIALEALREAAMVYSTAMREEAPGTMGDAVEIGEPSIDGRVGTIVVLVRDGAAGFVIFGTNGPITANGGGRLLLKYEDGSVTLPMAVEGQKANNFPQRARDRVREELAHIFRRAGMTLVRRGGWSD